MNNYKIINIYGTGRYVYLGPPDTQFNKDGVYHVTLEVPQDKAQEAIKEIDAAVDKEISAAQKARPNEIFKFSRFVKSEKVILPRKKSNLERKSA